MYKVKVFPTTISQYSTQVYAGLYDLQSADKLSIEVASYQPRIQIEGIYFIYIEVEHLESQKKRKILFDLADTGRLDALESSLSSIDYISKRSYSERFYDDLPIHIRRKVHPYGVNYSCSSPNIPILKLFIFHHILEFRRNGFGHLKNKFFRQNARFLLNLIKNDYSLNEDEFRSLPFLDTQHDVFFVTRLFRNDKAPGGLPKFSRDRIKLVAALREKFGKRFFGGIEDDSFSRATCDPDLLIARMPRRDCLTHMKNSHVAIVTIGANKSNPWKLGEYLAASSCILCGELEFSFPKPLVDGVHYCRFDDAEDCVQICSDLLNNLNTIDRIKLTANDYYEQNVRSEINILRIIDHAFSIQMKNK